MIPEKNEEKIIPIMPCPDIRIQVEFYKALGFEVLGLYTSPNPYAALKWNAIELHFWGSRKIVAASNSNMCFILVRDVDEVNEVFTAALKKLYGRIPRTGFPKITKVRNLVGDRRFTLTDPGGNTLYVGVQSTEEDRFLRTLENTEHAKLFTVLYDVVYSREDPEMAYGMLPKYSTMASDLQGLDKAKYLLVVLDIHKYLGKAIEDSELVSLLNEQQDKSKDWEKISKKHRELLMQEEE